MSLEIISYNIQYGKHMEKVDEWVRGKKADIVCFQEYPEDELGRFTSQYNELFAASFNKGSRTFGELIIYKPELILETAYGVNLGEKNKSLLSTAVGRRSALVGRFETESGSLVVANIHLEWLARMSYKLAQLDKVLTSIDEAFSDQEMPFIIVGDLNHSSVAPGNDLRNFVNQRGYSVGPRLNTHRFFGVSHQLDYLIYKGCMVENVTTEKTDDSDHRPMSFTVNFN